MKLTALWSPEQQFQNKDGSVLVAGKIYVYNLDRTQLVTTYANGSGTVENPNPIILDGNGRALCFANEEFKYTAVVCDWYGKELFSFEPVGLGGAGSDAQVSTEITSETLNVEKTFDPHTNTNTFDIELKDKDIDHWIGQHGAPIQISGDSQEAALPLPDTNHRDYVGSFIDRIEDGKYMYLKPGLYQVDCLIGFTQSDEDLQNDLGQVLVYTGNGSADESEAWQLDGAGPYTNDNRHNLHASFVRKVLDEGQTSNVDCSNLLYFAPGTPFAWSEAYIQRLSVVRLDSISTGSGEGGTGIERVIHDDTLSGDGTGESPLSCSGALEGKQDKLIPGDGISIINNVISCSAQGGGGGPTYTAGQYIDITPENVINVSGLQPEGNYLTPEDLEGYATTEDVEEATSGKLDASAYRAPVQSDWNQTNSSALDFIKNKPTIPSLDGYATEQYVIEQTSGKLDASGYTAPVNADWNSEGGLSEILNKPDVAGLIPGQGIEFTPSGDNYVVNCTSSGDVSKQYVDQAILSATSGKLDASDYTAPEQSDWNEADAADLAYIKNKPVEIGFVAGEGIRFEDLSSAIKISCSAQGGSTYTPGTGIDITNDVISVNSAVAMKSDIPAAQVQSDWTEDDTEDPAFIKNKPSEYELVAGSGVSITPSGTNYIISSTGGGGGGSTYTAGDGIDITGDVISVTSAVAKKTDLATLATKSEVQAVSYQNKILSYGSSVTMSQIYEYLNLNPYLGQNLMVKITNSDLPTAIVNKLGGQSQPVFAQYTHATKVESSGSKQTICFEAPITVTNYTGSTQYPQSYIVQILATEGSSYSGPVTWSVSYKELKADSDVFWVTLTYSSNTWTGDKTLDELQQAKDSGKLILLRYNEPGYYPSGNPPTPGFNSYGRVYTPSKWSGSNVYDPTNIFCAVYIGQNYIESSTYKPMIHILQANGNSSGNVTFRDILGAPMELAKASDLPDMSTYATKQYVQNETSAFITSGDLPSEEEVDFEEIDMSSYATQEYVASQVSGLPTFTDLNSTVSGKADKSELPLMIDYGDTTERSLDQIVEVRPVCVKVPFSQLPAEIKNKVYDNSYNDVYLWYKSEFLEPAGSDYSPKYVFETVLSAPNFKYPTVDRSAYILRVHTTYNCSLWSIDSIKLADSQVVVAHVTIAGTTPGSAVTSDISATDFINAWKAGKAVYAIDTSHSNDVYTIVQGSDTDSYPTLILATVSYSTNVKQLFVTSSGWAKYTPDFTLVNTETLNAYAKKTYVEDYVASQVSGKQDKLTFTYDSNDDIIGINGSGIGGTGGGSSYTAGSGIDITNDVISIDPAVVPSKTDLQSKLDTSAYVAPVNSDWTASAGLAQILNKPDTEEMDVQELSAGPGISINNGVISVSGQYLTQADLAGYATQTWVGQQGFLDSSDLAGYATTSDLDDAIADVEDQIPDVSNLATKATTLAGYGITNAYTKSEVNSSLAGKQNTLTSVTDVQLVNALPASPVAGVLYLIPEA